MTATIRGRVLTHDLRPAQAKVVARPAVSVEGVDTETVAASAVVAECSPCSGRVVLRPLAGEYRLTLAVKGGTVVTADVALIDGQEYGLASLLGLNGEHGYAIVVLDDGETMQVPAEFLADENGDAYSLGPVTAYTAAGTERLVEEAIGSKVEDIASAKIEELVKVEVEESAGPVIDAAVDDAVAPLRTDVVELEGEVGQLQTLVEGQGQRLTDVEETVEGLDDSYTALKGRVSAVEAASATHASQTALTALTSRVGTLETASGTHALKTTVDSLASRVASVETASKTHAAASDLTALGGDVDALEGRVEALEAGSGESGEAYDDTELRGRVDAVETDLDTLDGVVEALQSTTESHGSRLTAVETDAANLTTTVAGKASASDVTALEERVSDTEESITSLTTVAASHALASDVTAVESRTSLLEQQMSAAVVSILKLGATEEIPSTTPAGTLVVRVTE